jgi:SHS2 domain-containing protein
MSGAGFRIFDHTADVGIESWGPTPESALCEAAAGLYSLLCEPASIEERCEVAVAASGADRESLAIHFLQEALAAWHLRHLLLRRFEIDELTGGSVRARGFGEPYEPSRHQIQGELKAVTYHAAAFERRGERWVVTCIVDI